MTARQTMIVQGIHGALVLAVLISATVLGVQGTLGSDALVGIYGAAIGFAGGSAATIGTLGQAVNGKATIPISELANRETTLRAAMASAAASPAHTVRATPPVAPDMGE